MSHSPAQTPDQEIQAALSCAVMLRGLGDTFLKAFHATESDFLRLGRELEDANAKAMALADEAGALAALTSGEQVAHAADNLRAVLGKLVTICDLESEATDFQGLSRIAKAGRELTVIMHDFSRLVKHLSMLGVSTRIESARLGGTGMGFATLADDVENLALKIASSSSTIVTRCSELTAQTLAAQESMKTIQSVREGCSLAIVDVLQKDLDALDALIKTSSNSARETSDMASGLCDSVSEAVLSLQFHDIIRQQLEHVAEHSEEVRQEVLAGLKDPNAQDSQGEIAPWLHSALLLQRSQLGDARVRFAEAMEKLEQSLSDISAQIEAISTRSGELGGAGEGKQGVLQVVEGGVTGVVESLKEFTGMGERMATVMTGVKTSIEQMAVSATEIEEVGSEIELIAINASIKAAHTGEEGKALGVLASAIQKLSLEAAVQTNKVMELLAEVDGHSEEMVRLSSRHVEQAGLDQVFENLRSQIASLRGLDVQVGQSSKTMRARGAALAEEVAQSIESLSFQDELIVSMTAAEERLQNAVELMIPVLPPGGANLESPRLKAMLDRYTMEAERLVHQSVLGQAPQAEDTPIKESALSDDLGDNIELF
ncbi:arginine N-succinyltransferase [Fundidesulfovibrio butyratiphilus]